MAKIKMVVEMTRLMVVEVDTEVDIDILEDMACDGETQIDFNTSEFSSWDVVSEESPTYKLSAILN